jgi:hypothetical protein
MYGLGSYKVFLQKIYQLGNFQSRVKVFKLARLHVCPSSIFF